LAEESKLKESESDGRKGIEAVERSFKKGPEREKGKNSKIASLGGKIIFEPKGKINEKDEIEKN